MKMLEQLLIRYHPKLIYTMPTYHNPCGVSMSTAKKVRLLELAARYSVPILEDDPYSELGFRGQAAAPLKTMDKNGNVIYLSSFSKTIYPGLRLGWICADKKLIHHFSSIRQLVDLHSCCISQQIVERFIVNGEMEKYVESIRREYRERRDMMADALKRYAPKGLSWNIPEGGYYLWCRLPDGLSADLLALQAAKNGVAILPGMPAYLSKQKGECYIRLNYTFPPRDRITCGIKILCDVIRKLILAHQQEEPLTDNEINPIL